MTPTCPCCGRRLPTPKVADALPDTAYANARLIAKAPELLTAAQHAFSLLCKFRDEYGSVAHTPVHEELGRVIAAATGDKLALKAIAKMKGGAA